jgi:cobalamin biosynthesis Mg chelatase CobN
MAIISDFKDDEAPEQQLAAGHGVEEALVAALERSGGALPFLQAAIDVAHRRSGLFRDPSAVSKVTAMAAAVRAQIEAEERVTREAEAKRKAEEDERKAEAEAQRAAKEAVMATAEEKPESTVEKDSMEVDKKEEANVRRECSIPLLPVLKSLYCYCVLGILVLTARCDSISCMLHSLVIRFVELI